MRILVLNPNTSASMTAEIVAAAVALAQALVGMGLSTSKTGAYAAGPDNPRSHWPPSKALGLDG